jgi:hypothetical protein
VIETGAGDVIDTSGLTSAALSMLPIGSSDEKVLL